MAAVVVAVAAAMVAPTMTTAAAPATISGEGAFMAGIMSRIAGVALSVPRFIPVKMVEGPVAAIGQRPMVTVMGIVPVIDMAQETVPTVEPWASPDKDSVREPVRLVVAVRSAIVRSVVEVPVWTPRSSSNVYSNRNLGLGYLCTAQQRNGKQRKSKGFSERHSFSLMH